MPLVEPATGALGERSSIDLALAISAAPAPQASRRGGAARSLDGSAGSLHRRRLAAAVGPAPLKENLAAALIRLHRLDGPRAPGESALGSGNPVESRPACAAWGVPRAGPRTGPGGTAGFRWGPRWARPRKRRGPGSLPQAQRSPAGEPLARCWDERRSCRAGGKPASNVYAEAAGVAPLAGFCNRATAFNFRPPAQPGSGQSAPTASARCRRNLRSPSMRPRCMAIRTLARLDPVAAERNPVTHTAPCDEGELPNSGESTVASIAAG